jgi:type VI secretion system protein ImpL
LTQAKVVQPGASTSQLEWQVKGNRSPNEKPGGVAQDAEIVRFNFRVVSGANPLALAGLRRLTLPDAVTN